MTKLTHSRDDHDARNPNRPSADRRARRATSGIVTGYSKGWLTGAINCVLVQCNPAYKAEPYQEKLWELDIPNTKLSGGGPLRNKTTEAESRRPLE